MTEKTISGEKTLEPGATAQVLARRYRVVRQLGQGGMGSVWLAEDTQLDNRPVAVKMLPSVLVKNTRAYNQLKAEALVSMKLRHPNIATVRVFEENEGNPFLVIDYIDGQTLDDYLAERGDPTTGALAEEDVVRLLTPIAEALDYAHREGVVHRDVKPGNVMIAQDGTPYVLDFGIAREMQETLTRVTGKLSSGTLLYMSPEQLRGQSPKPAQDVYSFATMVYECLTGRAPFSRGQVEYQILNERPEPLDAAIEIAPSVMAGLEKEAEARPATCAGVLAREAATPQPTARPEPAPAKPPKRKVARPRLAIKTVRRTAWLTTRGVVIAAAAVAAVLVVGLIVRGSSVRKAKVAACHAALAAEERAAEVLSRIRDVSPENNFAARIAHVEQTFETAGRRFRQKDYAGARAAFAEATEAGERLLQADEARGRCLALYREAQAARAEGLKIHARIDAERTWQSAEQDLAEGQRLQDDGKYVEARMHFARARQGHVDARSEAERLRQERESETKIRQERAGTAAVDAIRREADSRIAACRGLGDAFASRVASCETLYAEAERLRTAKAWTDAATAYTNAVAACREVLDDNLRQQKQEADRQQREAEEAEKRRVAQEKAEAERRRKEVELEAYRRTHYPELYDDSPLKNLGKPVEYFKSSQRKPSGRGGAAFSDGASRLVGRWTCRYTMSYVSDNSQGTIHDAIDETYTFNRDGTFTLDIDFNKLLVRDSHIRGNWSFSGGELSLSVKNIQTDYRVLWQGNESFELRIANLGDTIRKTNMNMQSGMSYSARYRVDGHLERTIHYSGKYAQMSDMTTIDSPKVFTRTKGN